MATRSTIGIIDSKGKEKRIYCHNDGYLNNNGEILLKSWNSADKVNELMKFGNISSLKEYPYVTVIGQPPKDKEQHRYLMAVWQKNDIDPSNVGGTYSNREEYNYTWKNGRWYVEFRDEEFKPRNLPLEIALMGYEGHKTSVPKRGKHVVKKNKPTIRVNVEKMF